MRHIAAGIVIAMGLAVAPAAAADMAVKSRPMVAAPLWSWSGLYAGVNIGYGWSSYDVTATGLAAGTVGTSPNGLIGGAQIGYNWQAGAVVFGLEADIQASGIRGSVAGAFGAVPVTGNVSLDYFGTVRGRLGLAAGTWMPYITGGWAYGGASSTLTAGGVTVTGRGSSNNGWTIGGGVEVAGWAPNWTVKAEYLYIAFPGSTTVAGGTTLVESDFRTNVVRVGANYKF